LAGLRAANGRPGLRCFGFGCPGPSCFSASSSFRLYPVYITVHAAWLLRLAGWLGVLALVRRVRQTGAGGSWRAMLASVVAGAGSARD